MSYSSRNAIIATPTIAFIKKRYYVAIKTYICCSAPSSLNGFSLISNSQFSITHSRRNPNPSISGWFFSSMPREHSTRPTIIHSCNGLLLIRYPPTMHLLVFNRLHRNIYLSLILLYIHMGLILWRLCSPLFTMVILHSRGISSSTQGFASFETSIPKPQGNPKIFLLPHRISNSSNFPYPFSYTNHSEPFPPVPIPQVRKLIRTLA